MGFSLLVALVVVTFGLNAAAQYAQTTTQNTQGTPIYIGDATSSVAAPLFTATLVYNCYYMPLICENVANYAKTINPGGGGNLAAPKEFHFDPDGTALSQRRDRACGCFKHDDCSTARSQGKTTDLVTDIAGRAPFDTLNTPLSQASENIILAGKNPSTVKGVLQARAPLQSVPGRFFDVEGVAFSCDEFPAATFIEGGIGLNGAGNRAKTVCAMQSWQIYLAANGPGKWPLPASSGQQREQDWQGDSHGLLRNAYNIGNTKNKRGFGTVYPFSFTTTTLPAASSTKAYVIRAAAVTTAVMKRDGTQTTTTYIATTTLNVFGNDGSELRGRNDDDDWRQYSNEDYKSEPAVPRLRFRRDLAPTQTPGSGSLSSTGASLLSSGSTGAFSAVTSASQVSLKSNVSSSAASSSFPTTGGSASTGSTASAAKSTASTTGTGTSTSSLPTSGSSTVGTAPSSGVTRFSRSGSHTTTASTIQSSGVIVPGSPVATSSASAVSSNVSSASSAAAALVADPSNRQNAETAQKQTHDAKDAAAAMLALAIAGSPLAEALSSLIASLTTAAAVADTAVDAATAAAVAAAAAELVSDLADAAKDAEEVKEESDDNEPSRSPSATRSSPSTASRSSQTTLSSRTTLSTITSSVSSMTSSASATPSQCTIEFDIEGLEDIEVGDDYDGLDDDPGDDGLCVPIYGPGGSTILCGSSSPTTGTLRTNSGTSLSATVTSAAKSGSISGSSSPIRMTASLTRSAVTSSASSIASGSLQCTQPIQSGGPTGGDIADALTQNNGVSTLCAAKFDGSGTSTSETFNLGSLDIIIQRQSISVSLPLSNCQKGITAIIDQCIQSGNSYGGVYTQGGQTFNITNTIYPANPLIPGSSEPGAPALSTTVPPATSTSTPPAAAPTSTTPIAPPAPSQTSSNNKGSSLCSSIGGQTCQIAYSQYNDTYLYTAYTSYILPSGADSIVNDLFAPFANDGCAAMFTCNSNAEYAVGMTGAQIKAAFDNLYENDKVKVCGSSYLSNGCHVTVNGCDNCKPGVPCGSLPAQDLANGYPCYN